MAEYQKVILTKIGRAFGSPGAEIEVSLDVEENNVALGQRIELEGDEDNVYEGGWYIVSRLIGIPYEVYEIEGDDLG